MTTKTNSQGLRGLSVTFMVLAVAFCVCLITANLFSPRFWSVGNTGLQLPAAVVVFPISYIINDLLTEVYGYRKAMMVIWIGFAMNAFVALASHLVSILPPPLSEENQAISESFNLLFAMVPRTTAASLTAFIFGSHFNAWVMSTMKIKSAGKGFGWRAIISTIAGEFTDSVLFYPLAFLGIMPISTIVTVICTQVIVKTMYEVIILPITASLSRKLKAVEEVDTYDYDVKYNPFNFKAE